jgi:hypothetical protein
MLTTLAMACMLGQFQPPCSGPGCGGTGGFPVATYGQGHGRGLSIFHPYRSLYSLLFTECACPLGSGVPNGDLWAAQMHGMLPAPAAMPAPASTPASAPAQPANPPANPSAGDRPLPLPEASPDQPSNPPMGPNAPSQ